MQDERVDVTQIWTQISWCTKYNDPTQSFLSSLLNNPNLNTLLDYVQYKIYSKISCIQVYAILVVSQYMLSTTASKTFQLHRNKI